MKYLYSELNNKAQLKARLDYFDTNGHLDLNKVTNVFYNANGKVYEN